MNVSLLDTLKTSHGVLQGVIDSVTTKHVVFIDLTLNSDPEVIKIVMMWRLYYSNMRFMVFKEMFFKSKDFGRQILINKKSVISGMNEVSHIRPKRRSSKITIRSHTHVSDLEPQQS